MRSSSTCVAKHVFTTHSFPPTTYIKPLLQHPQFRKNENIKHLLVANKIGINGEIKFKGKFSTADHIIFITVKNNQHLEVLKEKMVDVVLSGKVQTENTIVGNVRHYHVLI